MKKEKGSLRTVGRFQAEVNRLFGRVHKTKSELEIARRLGCNEKTLNRQLREPTTRLTPSMYSRIMDQFPLYGDKLRILTAFRDEYLAELSNPEVSTSLDESREQVAAALGAASPSLALRIAKDYIQFANRPADKVSMFNHAFFIALRTNQLGEAMSIVRAVRAFADSQRDETLTGASFRMQATLLRLAGSEFKVDADKALMRASTYLEQPQLLNDRRAAEQRTMKEYEEIQVRLDWTEGSDEEALTAMLNRLEQWLSAEALRKAWPGILGTKARILMRLGDYQGSKEAIALGKDLCQPSIRVSRAAFDVLDVELLVREGKCAEAIQLGEVLGKRLLVQHDNSRFDVLQRLLVRAHLTLKS